MPPHDANYYLSWEAMSEGRGNDAPLVICAACSGLIGRPARRSPVVNNVLSYSSFLLPPAAPRCCCVVAMFISRVKEARETEVGETKRRLQRKKGIFLMSCLFLSFSVSSCARGNYAFTANETGVCTATLPPPPPTFLPPLLS